MFKQLSKKPLKTRPGATSLYVVVFASLLFTVIATGFVTVIMSEISQTINDELSQSAYDSALAGIEDAKLAIMKCASADRDNTKCALIGTEIGTEDQGGGCKTVSTILGREISEEMSDTDVAINESGDDPTEAATETLQAYTCVTINGTLSDYRSSLSSTDTDTLRIIPLRAADTSAITGIRISWYANTDNNDYVYRNVDKKTGRASFGPVSDGVSAPPTIAVQLIQTSDLFTINSGEIDYTNGTGTSQTSDRGTVFLVPSNTSGIKTISNYATQTVQVGTQWVQQQAPSGFIKANDKTRTNYPYVIHCDDNSGDEFACRTTIQLPNPVNTVGSGKRNPTSAMLLVSMPYDQPSTDFAVELCGADTNYNNQDDAPCSVIDFKDAQYAIDSTGRANDVYNRVEARVELSDIYFPYPEYEVQLSGKGDDILTKNFWATVSNCWYSNNGAVSFCSATSGEMNR